VKSTVTGSRKANAQLSSSPKVQKLANTITQMNNWRQTEEKTERQTNKQHTLRQNFSHGKTHIKTNKHDQTHTSKYCLYQLLERTPLIYY